MKFPDEVTALLLLGIHQTPEQLSARLGHLLESGEQPGALDRDGYLARRRVDQLSLPLVQRSIGIPAREHAPAQIRLRPEGDGEH